MIEGAIASAVDSCRNKFARHCSPPSIPPKVLLGTGSAKSVPCGCGEDLARGALCLACQETPPHESIAAQILTLYSHPIHIGLQLRLQSFERDRGEGSFDCAHHDTTGDQGFVCPVVREDSKVSSRRGRALYPSTCTRQVAARYGGPLSAEGGGGPHRSISRANFAKGPNAEVTELRSIPFCRRECGAESLLYPWDRGRRRRRGRESGLL